MLVINIIVLIYIFGLIFLIIGWFLVHRTVGQNLKIKNHDILISVVVPVRNEENNILRLLESLEAQSLPKENFEVIVVDDDSIDETVEIIERFTLKSSLSLRLIKKEMHGSSPKKEALELAIKEARGVLIFTTDGDCALPIDLLKIYCEVFEKEETKLISGPVTFFKPAGSLINRLWQHSQIVEFASLVGTAAVSIFYKKPNMCSGANLAFRKTVFLEVNGYEGNMHLASGDDEFLMHKIHSLYPEGLFFAKSTDCVVSTEASETIEEFYQQRKRWASKWSSYEDILPSLLAVFVFLANLSFCFLMLTLDFSLLFLFKVFIEFVFLGLVLNMLNRKNSIFFILLVQIIYPFYVCFFALNQLIASKDYVWKDRKLK